ncbi:MAG TPA: alginate lyase family protein [Polyangiaceae bacterium]|nr:alginate lyase family protein [Polyangiaceae bacterium]
MYPRTASTLLVPIALALAVAVVGCVVDSGGPSGGAAGSGAAAAGAGTSGSGSFDSGAGGSEAGNTAGAGGMAGAAAAAGVAGTAGAASANSGGAGPVNAHPATVFNAAELDVIRSRVKQKQQPQWGAYQKLLADAGGFLSFNKAPPKKILLVGGPDNTSIARDIFASHSKAAYACALAYVLTGQAKFADQAVAIMQKWQQVGVTLVGGSHAGLHSGSYLVAFMYAHDLLHGYSGWSGTERGKFQKWWRAEILPKSRLVVDEKMAGTDPKQWDASNWLEAALNCMLATAVSFDDAKLRTEIIGRLQKYFIGPWRIHQAPYGPKGKVVAIVQKDVLRKKKTFIQGVMYTGYGTSSLVQAFEMARYAGVDLWNKKTPAGVGYQAVIDQWFRWNYLNEEFHLHLKEQAAGVPVRRNWHHHDNILEVANNRYNMSADFKKFVAKSRPVLGNPRDEYATLTKGDMPL